MNAAQTLSLNMLYALINVKGEAYKAINKHPYGCQFMLEETISLLKCLVAEHDTEQGWQRYLRQSVNKPKDVILPPVHEMVELRVVLVAMSKGGVWTADELVKTMEAAV